jgi:Ca2+-binding EF-hand superfamily protein
MSRDKTTFPFLCLFDVSTKWQSQSHYPSRMAYQQTQYYAQQPQQAPQPQYAAPQPQYAAAPQPQYAAAPQPQYAAPQPQYAAPQPQYAAPQQPQYGAPAPQPQYAAPQYSGVGIYGAPAPTGGGSDPLRGWFDAVDTDRSGRIGSTELQRALSSAGFSFRAGVAEKIVRMFDKDHTGELDFMEFKGAHQFITTMSQAFRARDADRSGTLEGPEVRATLASSGFTLSEPVFQVMMRKFDHEKVGGLRFDDYIELCILLGTCRNVFAYYDRNRTGQVVFVFVAFFASMLTVV